MDYEKYVREILVGKLPGLNPTDNQIRILAEILKRNEEAKAAEGGQ